MSKRPSVDLSALTSEAAAPMPEASQRMATRPAVAPAAPPSPPPATPRPERDSSTLTANLEALAFKVPSSFRKRFRQCAVDADLKLNELLFEALDAWEEKRKVK